VFVPLAPLVAHSEANLKLWCQTSHLMTGNGSGCLQVLSWVAAPGAPGLGEALPAVPVLIEHEWMEVDFSIATVTENEAGRKSWFDRAVVSKPEVIEHPRDQGKVSLIDSKVEIEMIARLFANQRINAPAAVNPHVNVAPLKCLQHLYDIFKSHAIDEHDKSSHATNRIRDSAICPAATSTSGSENLVAGLLLLISERAELALRTLRAKHQQFLSDGPAVGWRACIRLGYRAESPRPKGRSVE
jgi:hypothetical protein